MHQPALRYRRDLDGLRALAVIPALLFHAYRDWAPGGFTGVDVFFVISGYLITRIILSELENHKFSLIYFYARRSLRIFPSLAVVLLCTLLAGWFLQLTTDYRKLAENTVAGSLFYSNIYLWYQTGYFSDSAQHNPLLHLWSLGVEEQFYLLWPALLLIAFTRKLKLFLFILLALTIASFSLNLWFVEKDKTASFYLLPMRFWELMAGALLATAEARRLLARPAWLRELLSATGLGIVLYGYFIIHPEKDFPGWWALLPACGTIFMIYAGPEAFINRHVLSHRLPVAIGLISYPLYLWHWPVLVFLHAEWKGPVPKEYLVYALAFSFLLAALTYYYLEKPIRAQRQVRRVQRTAIVLTVIMVMIAFLGLSVKISDLYALRYPEAVRPYADYHYDYKTAFRTGRCFIEKEGHTIHPECIDEGFGRPEHTSILLWGDSHSAQLYHGFAQLQKQHPEIPLAQYSRYKCPPYLNYKWFDAPNLPCGPFNQSVLDMVAKKKPDIVVLAARWGLHMVESMRTQLQNTVSALRKRGVKHIVLIGPVPVWQRDLHRIIVKYQQKNPGQPVPERLNALSTTSELGHRAGAAEDALVEWKHSTQDIDRLMRRMVPELGITYVSAFDIFCNPQGCITHTPAHPQQLVAYDSAHLTASGAEYLVRHIPESWLIRKE